MDLFFPDYGDFGDDPYNHFAAGPGQLYHLNESK